MYLADFNKTRNCILVKPINNQYNCRSYITIYFHTLKNGSSQCLTPVDQITSLQTFENFNNNF